MVSSGTVKFSVKEMNSKIIQMSYIITNTVVKRK